MSHYQVGIKPENLDWKEEASKTLKQEPIRIIILKEALVTLKIDFYVIEG